MQISLNGKWKFLPLGVNDGKAYASVELDYPSRLMPEKFWKTIRVPSFWNGSGFFNVFGADTYFTGHPRCAYPALHGVAWYRRTFHLPQPADPQSRLFLCFDSVMCGTEVYLNGTHIGSHIGGLTRFEVEGTQAARWGRKNIIALQVTSADAYFVRDRSPGAMDHVDPAMREHIRMSGSDPDSVLRSFTLAGALKSGGGIWKRCYAEVRPECHLGTVLIDMHEHSLDVRASVCGERPGGTHIEWTLSEMKAISGPLAQGVQEPGDGDTAFTITPPAVKPWTPDLPNRYTLSLTLKTPSSWHVRAFIVGFRSFGIEGGRFLLNGKPYSILGASHPNDHFFPENRRYIRKQLKLLKKANVRALTWSEEPPPPAWLEEMDRIGMLSFDYSGMQWRTPVMEAAVREIHEWMHQNYNHPSVVTWGIGHECSYGVYFYTSGHKPPYETPLQYFTHLNREIRQIDPHRPIVSDYHTGILCVGGDIDSLTTYAGWYMRTVKTIERIFSGGIFPDLAATDTVQRCYADDLTAGNLVTRKNPMLFTEPVGAYSDPVDGHLLQAAVRMRRIGRTRRLSRAQIKWVSQQFKAEFAAAAVIAIRMLRHQHPFVAGFFAFMVGNWFYHPLNRLRMKPKPVLRAFANAAAPRAAFLRTDIRHAHPAMAVDVELFVVNDAHDQASVRCNCRVHLTRGFHRHILHRCESELLASYGQNIIPIRVTIPAKCREGEWNLTVRGRFTTGERIFHSLPLVIVNETPRASHPRPTPPVVFDPGGTIIGEIIKRVADARPVTAITGEMLAQCDAMVIAPNALATIPRRGLELLADWCRHGKRLLVLEQTAPLQSCPRPDFPIPPAHILVDWLGGPRLALVREYIDANRNDFEYDDFVFVEQADHPVFDGIPQAYFSHPNGNQVFIASYLQHLDTPRPLPRANPPKYYRIERDQRIHTLASCHTFLRDDAICEIPIGNGAALFTQVLIASHLHHDPVCRRFFDNLIAWVGYLG